MSENNNDFKALTTKQFKNNPIMIAVWPGIANVGLMATEYVKENLGMKPFAFLDMRQLFAPQALSVEKGKFVQPTLPKSGFYYHLNPDVILFESEIQFEGKEGMFMLNMVLETAKHFNVSKIVILGAVPVQESHYSEPSLYCAANDDQLLVEFKKFEMKPADKAYIASPPGLLPGLAFGQGIKAGCVLGNSSCICRINRLS